MYTLFVRPQRLKHAFLREIMQEDASHHSQAIGPSISSEGRDTEHHVNTNTRTVNMEPKHDPVSHLPFCVAVFRSFAECKRHEAFEQLASL